MAVCTAKEDSYLEVKFLKALMHCAGITIRSVGKGYGVHQVKSLTIDNLCIPCLVGTEREPLPLTQGVMVTVAIFFQDTPRESGDTAFPFVI